MGAADRARSASSSTARAVLRRLILVIGLLIIIYARWYLGRDDPMGRFYAYLLLFQGAMLGIVALRQCAGAAGVLGAHQPHLVPADRLLAPPARGPPGRAHGAGRHRRRRPLADRRHAAARPGRRLLRADRDPAARRCDPGAARSTCRSCSWSWAGPSPSRPSSRSISGCRTRWRRPRRSRPTCTRPPW